MMTTEDAKAIIRYGVTDIPITEGIINSAKDTHRKDPLQLAINGRFPMINPYTLYDSTEFCFDGESKYQHSQDLQAWLRLKSALGDMYKESVLVRIDGTKKLITLVTHVKSYRESDTEFYLELPLSHPEVPKDKAQYPVGKVIEVCDFYHVLRFRKDQDAHDYLGRFRPTSISDVLRCLEYSDDQLQIKKEVLPNEYRAIV